MLFHHPEQADEHEQHDRQYSCCNDVLSSALFHVRNLTLPRRCGEKDRADNNARIFFPLAAAILPLFYFHQVNG